MLKYDWWGQWDKEGMSTENRRFYWLCSLLLLFVNVKCLEGFFGLIYIRLNSHNTNQLLHLLSISFLELRKLWVGFQALSPARPGSKQGHSPFYEESQGFGALWIQWWNWISISKRTPTEITASTVKKDSNANSWTYSIIDPKLIFL